jgi:hypothetical protein
MALEAVQRDLEGGLDPYDTAQSIGIAAMDALDEGRFVIGDVLTFLQRTYGEYIVATFAIGIGCNKKTCYQYGQVAQFYPIEERAGIRAMANVRYTHMRDAMRLRDYEAALAFLHYVADNDLTVEQAGLALKERLGKPTRPAPVFAGELLCITVEDECIGFKTYEPLALVANRAYRIKIEEIANE